jgi:hypothetical protein
LTTVDGLLWAWLSQRWRGWGASAAGKKNGSSHSAVLYDTLRCGAVFTFERWPSQFRTHISVGE